MENSHSVSNEEEEDDGTHRVLLHSYLRVRFDLSSSINFIDMNGFSQLGPRTLIRGYPRGFEVEPLDFMGMISY